MFFLRPSHRAQAGRLIPGVFKVSNGTQIKKIIYIMKPARGPETKLKAVSEEREHPDFRAIGSWARQV